MSRLKGRTNKLPYEILALAEIKKGKKRIEQARKEQLKNARITEISRIKSQLGKLRGTKSYSKIPLPNGRIILPDSVLYRIKVKIKNILSGKKQPKTVETELLVEALGGALLTLGNIC